jgi:geranylgeranyl pyrophosphate synthase
MQLQQSSGLSGFIRRVERHVDESIDRGGFDASQRDLLRASAAQYRPRTHKNPLGDPLAVFYLISRAHREELDEQGLELASFCSFYLLALDLLDDVQDHDLSGKPHASVGAGMAVNDALTLLFLGLSALERTMRLERSPQRRMLYLKIVNRVALTTGRGQHRDLLGEVGARTPEQVLAMQREKTASLALLCECAALYAGVSDEERERYRRVGENLSLLVQMLDDVRDVYGKSRSPDLETSKMTYPLACFLERATEAEQARFSALRSALPGSLGDLRRMLYDSGAIARVAGTMENCRREIHRELSAFGEDAPHHRVLLFVVDQLVEGVYTPRPIADSAALREPRFGWHAHVRRLARELSSRLAPYSAETCPPLVPWHLPQWTYDKRRGVIFYPDVEGLPEETLALHASLLGEDDSEVLTQLMWRQAPALVAHELFHHYRDARGQLSTDAWREELVANTLAVAYCARFEPDAVAGALELSGRVLSRPEHALSEKATAVVTDLLDPARPERPGTGYGLDFRETTLVHLHVIRALALAPESLPSALQRLLALGAVAA